MKLIKHSKLLTFQVILSLIILNTQISFAQSKFDGSYIGAKLGSAKGSADSNEVAGATYNSTNVGNTHLMEIFLVFMGVITLLLVKNIF